MPSGAASQSALARIEAQLQALPSLPKAASADASLRKPTNYLVGAFDSKTLQAAFSNMAAAERSASQLAHDHLNAVKKVGDAASVAIAKSSAASRATAEALATLERQTEGLKLGFSNGAGFCGFVTEQAGCKTDPTSAQPSPGDPSLLPLQHSHPCHQRL
jgi:hypothetical protein